MLRQFYAKHAPEKEEKAAEIATLFKHDVDAIDDALHSKYGRGLSSDERSHDTAALSALSPNARAENKTLLAASAVPATSMAIEAIQPVPAVGVGIEFQNLDRSDGEPLLVVKSLLPGGTAQINGTISVGDRFVLPASSRSRPSMGCRFPFTILCL